MAVDSDWAGDKSSRKSIDCIVVRVGGCFIHMSLKGQTFLAQSSCEAEMGGAHRGSLFAIGLQNLWHELFGEDLSIEVGTDSSAGLALTALH